MTPYQKYRLRQFRGLRIGKHHKAKNRKWLWQKQPKMTSFIKQILKMATETNEELAV